MIRQLEALYAAGISIPPVTDLGVSIGEPIVGEANHVLLLQDDGEYVIQNLRGQVRKPRVNGVVYIAGPMRGLPAYNFPAFDAARDLLISAGFYVFNPADLDRAEGVFEDTPPDSLPKGFMRGAMRRDTDAVTRCTHIYLLPGWEDSRGVRPEGVLGNELDLKFLTGPTLEEVPRQAVAGIIGGRLVAAYTRWSQEQDIARDPNMTAQFSG